MGDNLLKYQKTVSSQDPLEFDNQVNQLILDGYKLKKKKVVSTEEKVYFVAFLRKKIIKEDFESLLYPSDTQSPMK